MESKYYNFYKNQENENDNKDKLIKDNNSVIVSNLYLGNYGEFIENNFNKGINEITEESTILDDFLLLCPLS